MKARGLAGAVAALLYGGVALAEDCPLKQDGQAQRGQSQPGSSGGVITGVQPLPSEVQPREQDSGGSGAAEVERKADKRSITVLLGGGIEGYTRALAPDIDPGPALSVTAALRPTRMLGLELSYTSAANNIDTGRSGGALSGPDIIRYGGQAVSTFGLTARNVQPFVLAGIGVSYYDVRTTSESGFLDDTVGHVPVGMGVRTHLGHFTADARLTYNFLFDQEFDLRTLDANVGDLGSSGFAKGGSYLGTINAGATF